MALHTLPRSARTGDDAPYANALIAVSIDAGAKTILGVAVTPAAPDPHQELINFSLSDGTTLPFQIVKNTVSTASIVPKPGETLSAAAPYKFVLSVNELGNAARNSVAADVVVTVAVDNVPPEFVTAPTSGTVKERSSGEEIVKFVASDANHQVVTFSITYEDLQAEADADAEEIAHIAKVNSDAEQILDVLDVDEFEKTGVLNTLEDKDKSLVNREEPDFNETPEDNPDTIVDESDPDLPAVNSYVYTISVNDGTLDTENAIQFTLTVTDEVDPDPGYRQKLTVDEDQAAGAKKPFGTGPELDGPSPYTVEQQIDNKGNIAGVESGNEDDVLFGVIPDTGQLFMREADSIDFESGITTYTLSISRGQRSAIAFISVNDVNEAPKFSTSDENRQDEDDPDGVKVLDADGEPTDDDVQVINLYVLESAEVGDTVSIGQDAGGNPTPTKATFMAKDEDVNADHPEWSVISYNLWYDADLRDEEGARDEEYAGADAMVTVDSDGSIKVNRKLNTDGENADSGVTLRLRAYNASEVVPADAEAKLVDWLEIRVEIIDTNVAPEFDIQSQGQTQTQIAENTGLDHVIFTYFATDEDGDLVKYRLRSETDTGIFEIGELDGVLTLATELDYETKTSHEVEVQAYDTDGDTDEVVLTVAVTNVNDEVPVFDSAPETRINVAENTPRGTMLSNYSATDADGDTVTYSLMDGGNSKSFQIDSATGDLMTLESLDYDSNTPCSLAGCTVTVIATDGVHNAKIGIAPNEAEPVVTIIVSPIEDSVSTLHVTKANPVPGTTRGDPMTALGNTKESISDAVPERPADLPNKTGAPLNFVETDWANWGTVLRIEVTAQSPDATCGSGNECVIINLNSDSADDTLQVKAYRMDTPAGAASNENKFVAAVMLVELDGDATDIKTSANVDIPVYKHGDGTVARLQVDEEDEIEIEFGQPARGHRCRERGTGDRQFCSGARVRIRRSGRGVHLHGDGQPFRLARA